MIREKVKTGIAGLDEMLDGGLIPGRPYVVSGTSGTGKTAVAVRFLLEGANEGEQVLYVAIDEPPNEVKSNVSSFGWDLSKVYVFDATPDILSYDKTPVRDVSTERKVVTFDRISSSIRKTSDKGPADITINTIQELIKQEMKTRKYARVVIDSVTSLRRFYIRTSEEYLALQSFFRLLSDLGVTTVLTVQLPEVSKPEAEGHMARGEIRLHRWFDGRGLVRGVTVEKYRGSSHDHSMRTLKMADSGISIKPTSARKKPSHTSQQEMPEVAEEPEPPASEEPVIEEAPPAAAKTQPKAEPEVTLPPPPDNGEELPPPPDDVQSARPSEKGPEGGGLS